jgi:outer membrane protein assembly factor BamB
MSAFALGTGAAAAGEQNWPQWRGPLGIGVAPDANPPVSWSETKNIRWKVKVPGLGLSTPVIWGERVFIQTAIPAGKKVEATAEASAAPANAPGGRGGGIRGPKPTEAYQFVILCLDRKTGQAAWQQVAREEVPHEARHRTEGSFASASPVTDGQHVYAFFGSRGLHCYDLSGKLQWSKDLGRMQIVMSFGEGSSPVLCGDALIVNWDHEGESFITALDKKNGASLWKVARPEKSSWATPLVVTHNGKPQVIVAATGKIRSYDPATGKVIWECGGLTRNVIPSPVTGNGLFYATSGYQGTSLLAVRLGREGDLTGSDAIAWSYKKKTPYVPSPLCYEGKLFFFDHNKANLTCLDAQTGAVLLDAETVPGLEGVYASPLGAAGRVYLVGRNGATVVLKPSGKMDVLATNILDEKTDASPTAVGNELFLRGREYLYCIAEK